MLTSIKQDRYLPDVESRGGEKDILCPCQGVEYHSLLLEQITALRQWHYLVGIVL